MQKLLGSIGLQSSQTQKDQLNSPISQKVTAAHSDEQNNKTPGPDSDFFFQILPQPVWTDLLVAGSKHVIAPYTDDLLLSAVRAVQIIKSKVLRLEDELFSQWLYLQPSWA